MKRGFVFPIVLFFMVILLTLTGFTLGILEGDFYDSPQVVKDRILLESACRAGFSEAFREETLKAIYPRYLQSTGEGSVPIPVYPQCPGITGTFKFHDGGTTGTAIYTNGRGQRVAGKVQLLSKEFLEGDPYVLMRNCSQRFKNRYYGEADPFIFKENYGRYEVSPGEYVICKRGSVHAMLYAGEFYSYEDEMFMEGDYRLPDGTGFVRLGVKIFPEEKPAVNLINEGTIFLEDSLYGVVINKGKALCPSSFRLSGLYVEEGMTEGAPRVEGAVLLVNTESFPGESVYNVMNLRSGGRTAKVVTDPWIEGIAVNPRD